jgi:hypothetical protein
MSRPVLRVISGGGVGPGGASRQDLAVDSAGESQARQRRSPVGAARARKGRGLLGSAVSSAGAWLIEPIDGAEPAAETAVREPTVPRVVIAVFGLARGSGATVVARALAAELARRDASGTAAVACEARQSGIPLATGAASRLAGALEDVPGATTRAIGRVCLVGGADHRALAESSRYLAPLVLDTGSASVAGAPASVADRSVLVATPAVEPALARAAAACLERVGALSVVVLNRARSGGDSSTDDGREVDGDAGPDAPPGVLPLPESRLGAQLALGGREARGELGRAIGALADWCEGAA